MRYADSRITRDGHDDKELAFNIRKLIALNEKEIDLEKRGHDTKNMKQEKIDLIKKINEIRGVR